MPVVDPLPLWQYLLPGDTPPDQTPTLVAIFRDPRGGVLLVTWPTPLGDPPHFVPLPLEQLRELRDALSRELGD